MYDLVLTGGLVYDGTGAPAQKANLYISDGKIAAITPQSMDAKESLDVSGLAVTPGFIDIHSHSDNPLFTCGTPENALRQGVTTQIVGNCGSSIFPAPSGFEDAHREFCMKKYSVPGFNSVTDYAAAIDQACTPCNYGMLVGHNNLRGSILNYEDRQPTAQELEIMCQTLERELQRGAFGMSLGLIYPPSSFAGMEELTALARVIAKYNGILSVHMRNEGPRIFKAVEEMVQIVRASGVHLQISHLKLMGTAQWGQSPKLLALLEDARAEGLNITADQYPFPASSTAMSALLPRWAKDGGTDAMLARVAAREGTLLQDISREMESRGGAEGILVISANGHPEYRGKRLSQIAEDLDVSPAEAACRVLADTGASCKCIYFCINQEDILRIMGQRWVCVGSDGSDNTYASASAPMLHPRNFSTFSQFFQTVRENQLMPLQDAVRKATGLTASILGLTGRGTLTPGSWADIAVFEPEGFASRSSFLTPNVPPAGMHHVLVAGQFVVKDQQLTGLRPGKAILK